MYMCDWQFAVKGHRAYTDLSAAKIWAGTMHSLQPCQLRNDSLLNMVACRLCTMRGGNAMQIIISDQQCNLTKPLLRPSRL